MQTENASYKLGFKELIATRSRAYLQLIKLRLALLVVFSAAFGYLMAPSITGFDPVMLLLLSLGGLLVTGASNTLNQVLEAEYDGLMKRTQSRPLVTGVIGKQEALVFGLLTGAAGIAILGYFFGSLAALLGVIALLSYAFVYTPVKRHSPFSVLIGAFPGAMPPLIGWAAAAGSLDLGAGILFMMQFIWQFPHFWAIGWLLNDDYRTAGFQMLPGNAGKSAYTARLILIYTLLLIPAAILPFQVGMVGIWTMIVLLLAGAYFSFRSLQLVRKLDDKSAKGVMFGSFIYLPVIQIAMLIDKF